MKKQKVQNSLDEFQKKLEDTSSINLTEREMLEQLGSDIQDLLDHDDGDFREKIEQVNDDLEQAIRHFEASHPELTLAITHLMNILSQEGI